jgi:hypothetical protein
VNFLDQFRVSYAAAFESHRVRREAFLARMKGSEQLKNAIETVLLFRNRLRMRSDARKRMKIRIQALTSVRKTLEHATTMRAQNIQVVFNVALYLMQLDQDLAYFTTDMVQAVGDRRRAFVAKHEAVLLYEVAEDVPQLLGKQFRGAIAALSIPEEQVQLIKAVSSDLNRFWREHRVFLGTIRNVLAAHRERDALTYARALDAIEPLEVMHRAAELSELVELLVQQLIAVVRLTSSPTAVLTDIVRSNGDSTRQKRSAV